MTDTITTNYHWVKPEIHASPLDWGVKINADLDLIDAKIYQLDQGYTVSNQLVLNKTVVANGNPIIGQLNSVNRWVVEVGDGTAEGGSNAGSNFVVSRYTDAGALIDAPLTITRSSGATTVAGTLNANGGVSAKAAVNITAQGAGNSTLGLYDSAAVRRGFLAWLNSGSLISLGKDSGASIQLGTGITLSGNVTLNGNMGVSGDAGVGGNFAVTGVLTVSSGTSRIQRGALTAANLLFHDNSVDKGSVQYQTTNQSMTMFNLGAASNLSLDGVGNFTFNGAGAAMKTGGGSWAAISDERLKDVVNAYDAGLPEVLRLQPVTYRYKGADKVHVGLVAQQAELVMPELVSMGAGEIDGKEVDDLRSLDPSAVIWALVNAVKDLKRELDELRTKLP